MIAMPPETLYHRWLGWHASSLRRAIVVASIGLMIAVVLLPFVTWGMAVGSGWTPPRSPSTQAAGDRPSSPKRSSGPSNQVVCLLAASAAVRSLDRWSLSAARPLS
jgi:hypothetical protein